MGYKKLTKIFLFLFLVLTISLSVNASEGVDLSGSRVITWGIDIGQEIISDIKVFLSNVIVDSDLDMLGYSIYNVGNMSVDNITTYSNKIHFNDSINVNGNVTSHNIYPLSSLLYDLGSGPLRWRYLYVANVSAEEVDISGNLNVLGEITSSFGNFTELFAGGVNVSGLSNQFLNLSGTNANQDIDISPYNLNVSNIILDDHSCLDFGTRETSICESGTVDIDIKTGGRIDIWADNEVSFRVDNDVNDYFHIETNDDVPTLRSYLSNMALVSDEGLIDIYGNTTIHGNATAHWFNGQYNWTTIDDWNIFNGYELEFNTSKLSTIYYSATQSFLVDGVIDGGTLENTQHPDGHYDGVTFNFSEQVATNALDLKVNFTGVEDFNAGVIRYKTSALSGDYPIIQLWSYDSEQWEDYPLLAESQTFAIITQPVFDSSDHIQDGIVQMRLYKEGSGKSNNHYYVDWIAISKGYGTPAGEEIDPYSIHSDGDVPLSDNWDVGNQTISNIRNITVNEYAKLGNLWICNYTITSNLTKSQEEGDC